MLQKFFTGAMALAVVSIFSPSAASAAPIIPTYTSFGTLTGATFGGSGIPNDAVAIGQGGGVTIGLTAHQRYDNATVTNDGAGTFFAAAGSDMNTVNPNPVYATWNFGFYFADTNPTAGNLFNIYWDFDPAVGNDESTHGALLGWTLPANPHQDSQNLGMAHLAFFANQLPQPGAFDPNQQGLYTFKAQAFSANRALLTETAIAVCVGDPANCGDPSVPEPVTVAMLGLGLIGAGIARRRQRVS